MNLPSLLHRRRFSFSRVFWITLAVYLSIQVIGLVVMFVTPAVNKPPNWAVVFSWYNLLSQSFSILFYTVFYFVTLNMFHRLLAGKHKPVQYIQAIMAGLLLLVTYAIITFLFFTRLKVAISVHDTKVTDEKITTGLIVFAYLLISVFNLGASLLIAYLTYLQDEKKQRKILEAQKIQLEVEKSQANLNFLKAQINPHFLHNTLNFLYAKSLPYSSELSEGILTLSDIMRYALGPAAKDGKVLLKDEIEHMRNVIKINQLRFSNNLHVSFEVNGVVNGATIIPFLLITLVENAFKHGDLKSPEHPITIRLNVADGVLHFYCHNKKKSGPKEISTGIGLDNIKKQLDLAYGRKYSFHVKDEAEFYTTELTINAV